MLHVPRKQNSFLKKQKIVHITPSSYSIGVKWFSIYIHKKFTLPRTRGKVNYPTVFKKISADPVLLTAASQMFYLIVAEGCNVKTDYQNLLHKVRNIMKN